MVRVVVGDIVSPTVPVRCYYGGDGRWWWYHPDDLLYTAVAVIRTLTMMMNMICWIDSMERVSWRRWYGIRIRTRIVIVVVPRVVIPDGRVVGVVVTKRRVCVGDSVP